METLGGGSSSSKTPPKAVEALKKDVSFDVPAELSRSTHQETVVTSPTADEDTASRPSPPSNRRESIIKRIKAWSPALVLENSGSVARDHLASERTWLAYIRTSLAISSSGVALVQLFTIAANRTSSGSDQDPFAANIQRYARPLGAATVLIGLGVCLLGLYRYFRIQSSLTTGKFPTARLEVHSISLLLGCLSGIVFGVLVAYPR